MSVRDYENVDYVPSKPPISLLFLSLSWDEEDNKDEDYEKAIISPPKPLSPSP